MTDISRPPQNAPRPSRARPVWTRIGPGILMAGAAIGVSHLVQATRAGASFGLQLLAVIVIIHVLKYPFFEYGHRYAAATGESLLHGYARLGRAFIFAFVALVAVSGAITVAGVTFLTAGLAQTLTGGMLWPAAWAALLLVACVAILAAGHYRLLELSMRAIMTVLMLATVLALASLVANGATVASTPASSPFALSSLGFLIALMGWMPAPIEGAAFQSLWVRERDRVDGIRTTLREARTDFDTGYGVTLLMAVLFMLLGAFVMYGSGVEFSDSAAGFAGQFVQMYVDSLGPWAAPVVATAALATMFSTMLAIVDAYPRSLTVGIGLMRGHSDVREGFIYWIALIALCGAALVIIHAFLGSLRGLIDLATTMAFLSAPILGWLNFRLLTSEHTPAELRPGSLLRTLSWIGLVFFVVLGGLFVVHRFAPGVLS